MGNESREKIDKYLYNVGLMHNFIVVSVLIKKHDVPIEDEKEYLKDVKMDASKYPDGYQKWEEVVEPCMFCDNQLLIDEVNTRPNNQVGRNVKYQIKCINPNCGHEDFVIEKPKMK